MLGLRRRGQRSFRLHESGGGFLIVSDGKEQFKTRMKGGRPSGFKRTEEGKRAVYQLFVS